MICAHTQSRWFDSSKLLQTNLGSSSCFLAAKVLFLSYQIRLFRIHRYPFVRWSLSWACFQNFWWCGKIPQDLWFFHLNAPSWGTTLSRYARLGSQSLRLTFPESDHWLDVCWALWPHCGNLKSWKVAGEDCSCSKCSLGWWAPWSDACYRWYWR